MNTKKLTAPRITRRVCESLMCIGLVATFTTTAHANGTEILKAPSIAFADGTATYAAGVGLVGAQAGGTIELDIPADVTIKQVLLYWEGVGQSKDEIIFSSLPPVRPDAMYVTKDPVVGVNGVAVNGTQIGGPNLVDTVEVLGAGGEDVTLIGHYSLVYRADITDLNLVAPGSNTLVIDEMHFSVANHGASILVIADDGSAFAEIQARDGNDLACAGAPYPANTTAGKWFEFAPASVDRVMRVNLMFSHNGNRGLTDTSIEVKVNGVISSFVNLLSSADGADWDNVALDIDVPAGASWAKVRAFANDDGETIEAAGCFNWLHVSIVLPPENTAVADGLAGDFVWIDVNGNGLQEVGEPGEANCLVQLLDIQGNVVQETTTDAQGFYLFSNVELDTPYVIKVSEPQGLPGFVGFTNRNFGDDRFEDIDSDVDAQGLTAPFIMTESDPSATDMGDAGLLTQ